MLAVAGETITERVGVINLSLDGTMMLTAMAGFVIALNTQQMLGTPGFTIPVLAGLAAAGLIGALVALIVAWGSIRLKQDQVAIGFVLTLLLADMAKFLGQHYTSVRGLHIPRVTYMPIPVLKDIPVLGPIFFDKDVLIYGIIIMLAVIWWWMYRTQPGLQRGVGERPNRPLLAACR
jgi:simple sugar transport system permease protein